MMTHRTIQLSTRFPLAFAGVMSYLTQVIRRTLGEVKPYLARSTESGLCPDNPRLVFRINEAQERLLNKGKWPFSKVRYNLCIYGGCITLPRELETILAIALNNTPVPIRNDWFEFNEAGPGISPPGGNGITPIDRGTTCLFQDVCGIKGLQAVTDQVECPGAGMWVKGYGSDGKRVKTVIGGNGASCGDVYDGEWLSFYGSPIVESQHQWVAIDAIVKTRTNGHVHLYQVDPDTQVPEPIGLFHGNETLPLYRRYEIANSLNYKTVDILAKRRFIPAEADNDDLMITCLGALKLMLRAIEKEENNQIDEALKYEAAASRLLSEEYKEYMGGIDARGKFQMRGYAMGTIPSMR